MTKGQQETLEWIAAYVRERGYNPSQGEIYDHIRQQTLDWIAAFVATNGYSPSLREITDGLGLGSTNTTSLRLRRLKEAGKITYQPNVARSIVIVSQ